MTKRYLVITKTTSCDDKPTRTHYIMLRSTSNVESFIITLNHTGLYYHYICQSCRITTHPRTLHIFWQSSVIIFHDLILMDLYRIDFLSCSFTPMQNVCLTKLGFIDNIPPDMASLFPHILFRIMKNEINIISTQYK